jgi:trehalose 6-phosphate synthase
MRLSLRFILPLAAILGLLAYGAAQLVESFTLKWAKRDLDAQSNIVAKTIQEPISALIRQGETGKIKNYLDRTVHNSGVLGLGFCAPNHQLLYSTQYFPKNFDCSNRSIEEAPKSLLHFSLMSIGEPGPYRQYFQPQDTLAVAHDMTAVLKRSEDVKRYVLYVFAFLAVVVSFVTVLIAHLSWRGWISGMRSIVKGVSLFKPLSQIAAPELRPFAKDLRTLIHDLEAQRRARDENQVQWNPKALRAVLNHELAGDEILVVSNREPYVHLRKGDKIEVSLPASGLVTALEPIMRACSGTWIAHGSGSADRDVVDKHDHVQVPPDNPSYQIRRVWLTKEEENGYYNGFSNEGLWPLCHIAHTRPIFRTSDWNQYVKVNQKFAQAVLEEAKTKNPVILVQDYHFALLPKMIRDILPDATVITFWHIPWPNPEAFGICPWREEILEGLLGSSILGFHIQFHCNNFVDTVDRFLESRIDRETSTISRGGQLTAVNPYPISIEWPMKSTPLTKSVSEAKNFVRSTNQLPTDRLLGIGVDRLDYTKGIVERFLAVEKLLELESEWIGKFTFIQIASPSRTSIAQYQNFDTQVQELANRINARFGKDGYLPILLKVEHHNPDQVLDYYRGSDVCFVSSLHDGMNLVAKEFVASRDDERGVLILSQFTGASRELTGSLIVNPYNIDQCASALSLALRMPESEQRARMRSMRSLVQEFNVFRWAGKMLLDASRIRQKINLMGRIQKVGLRRKQADASAPSSSDLFGA